MNAKVYAKIMTVVANNCNDRDYTQIEHMMRRFLEEEE